MPADVAGREAHAASAALRLRPRGRGASVQILDGVHPERAARVSVADFEGPLALLLSLIEARQLDVLSVPLGDLAGAYLDAVAALPAVRMPHVSGFVAVCAQLILIKSRALLPRASAVPGVVDADADPEAELRERLLLYRRYRDASRRLAERLTAGVSLMHREAGAARNAARAGARPPVEPPLDPEVLRRALHAWLAIALPPELPPGVMPRTVTLEERAALIRRALESAPSIVLQDLLRDVRDRVVVAVTFLAMLELVKGRELIVEQLEPWGPITCRTLRGAGSAVVALPVDDAVSAA